MATATLGLVPLMRIALESITATTGTSPAPASAVGPFPLFFKCEYRSELWR